MKCPDCEQPMLDATVGLEKSISNFLVFGFGSNEMFVYPEGEKKIRVMTAGERVTAYRCPDCKTIVMKSYA